MKGGTLLLLLAALVQQAPGSNGMPQVTMSPILNPIYSGDTFYLSCGMTTSGSAVKWFLNGKQEQMSKTWKIEAASSKHTGSYQCESEGKKSGSFDIQVLNYVPSASLSIIIGQPVIQSSGSVILQLSNEDGLTGWKCWVHRGNRTNKIKLKLDEHSVSINFTRTNHIVPEYIYWCTNGSQAQRSNQIMVRTSDKPVSLEMYPLPAVIGESLTLRCLVWGTDQIQKTVFYKDGKVLLPDASQTYEIPQVTESVRGVYKCNSTYTYGPPVSQHNRHTMSDDQDVLVQESPVKAVISEENGLSCSCASCPREPFYYHWHYKKDDSQQWKETKSKEGNMPQPENGIYACKVVWNNGRSLLSNRYTSLVQQAPGSNGMPQVTMSPILNPIYSGDTFYLSCGMTTSGSAVKWFLNGKQEQMSKTWKIEAASSKHTGSYQCESEGKKSGSFDIQVLNYVPSASLSIIIGQPVIQSSGSVILQLSNEDGLTGWKCWVHRGNRTNKIKLKLDEHSVSINFTRTNHTVPETIYWCTNGSQAQRSNQIMVRTSDKPVSLEMYPLPAVIGESLTLRCLVWGTDQIQKTVFYKDGKVLLPDASQTYEIPKVTESVRGVYKCNSTYTIGPPVSQHNRHTMSDDQDVLVQESPVKAVISEENGLSCSCASCPREPFYYHWHYKKDDSQQWKETKSKEGNMPQPENGIYACKVVWNNGRSLLSNRYTYPSPFKPVIALAAFSGPIFEDVGQMSQDRGNEYEMSQKSLKAGREGEYDTLHSETQGRQRGGEYEALKRETNIIYKP